MKRGANADISRWPVARGRRSYESPILVGRHDEERVIEDALRAASNGEGALVTVVGEAGIGKSRLARHAQRRAAELGGGLVVGLCDEGSAIPYLPFVEGIGNHLAQLGPRSVRRRLGPLALELTDLFPQLEPRYRRPAGEDPQRSKLRLFEAITSLLRVLAEDHLFLLLVLEDMQWADSSSLELLSFLVKRIETSPVAVLITVRSTEGALPDQLAPAIDGWRRAATASTLALRPLSAADVGAMAAAILGDGHVDAALVERLFYLSEGNPLLVEDLIWESAGAQPADQIDAKIVPLPAVGVPATFAQRVSGLLRRLEPDEIETLQAAAVLTPPLAIDTLARVTNRTQQEVGAALAAAATLQLVEADDLGRFRFRHHLIRESLYQGQPEVLRRELHRRAAAALESDLGSAAFEIARHLVESAADEAAVPACLRAAEQATLRKGYQEAARLYEWALPHITNPALRGQVLSLLGEACYASSARDVAAGHLEEAITLLDAAGKKAEAAHARLILGTCEYQGGRGERARELFERVVADLEEDGPSEELADAYVRLSSLHVFQLKGRRADELAGRALEIAQAANSLAQEAWAKCFLGLAMVLNGEIEGGIAALDDSYGTALGHGFDWIALNAVFNGLSARLDHLRASECPEWLRRLRELPGASMREAFAADIEARMLLELGDVDGALRAARSAHQLAERSGIKTVAAWSQRRSALALVEAGHVEQAVAEVAETTEPSEMQEVLFDRLVRIRVHLAAGELTEAGDVARLLITQTKWMPRDTVLIAAATEALVAGGHVDGAEQLVNVALEGGLDPADPFLAMSRASVLLAQGREREARDPIDDAISDLNRRGYKLAELRARLIRLAIDGDEVELRALIADATAGGAGLIVREARRLGATAGIKVRATTDEPATAPASSKDPRLSLIARLPLALRDDEFVLHFQPEVDLASGLAVAAEALIRWKRVGRPLLLPDRFVPLAEQAGLINEVTGWVLDTALGQAAAWADQGAAMPVAVNISVHDLERATFVNRVAAALSAHRLDASLLCLEITETSAMQAMHAVVTNMERLRALGVRLSIDDFGTGQSSLAYLRHLPADEVKLDRSFCLDPSAASLSIVRSVITMAHELGLRVVAEGIEQQQVGQALQELGCDVGQGYLFGPPAPAEELESIGRPAV
ncbi:MAG TPA: EAL domain-containing protein [Candidatus Dormibacteraeota bacterium]